MNTTIIQVPVTKSLRDAAAAAADDFGFSSVQESIRVFLKQLASKKLTISFAPKTVQLSPKAINRYNEAIDDIKSGKEKLFTTNSVDELMSYLNQD